MKKIYIIIVALLCMFLFSCGTVNTYKEKRECVAVWFHENNRYSVSVLNNKVLTNITFQHGVPVEVIFNLKEGEPLWYETNYTWNSFYGTTKGYIKIYVRNINDINGAGWNHGKFGSGRTTRIN